MKEQLNFMKEPALKLLTVAILKYLKRIPILTILCFLNTENDCNNTLVSVQLNRYQNVQECDARINKSS